MASKEAEIAQKLALLDLSNEEILNRIDDLDKKFQQSRPILAKAAHSNLERTIAIAITVINLLILLLS